MKVRKLVWKPVYRVKISVNPRKIAWKPVYQVKISITAYIWVGR